MILLQTNKCCVVRRSLGLVKNRVRIRNKTRFHNQLCTHRHTCSFGCSAATHLSFAFAVFIFRDRSAQWIPLLHFVLAICCTCFVGSGVFACVCVCVSCVCVRSCTFFVLYFSVSSVEAYRKLQKRTVSPLQYVLLSNVFVFFLLLFFDCCLVVIVVVTCYTLNILVDASRI